MAHHLRFTHCDSHIAIHLLDGQFARSQFRTWTSDLGIQLELQFEVDIDRQSGQNWPAQELHVRKFAVALLALAGVSYKVCGSPFFVCLCCIVCCPQVSICTVHQTLGVRQISVKESFLFENKQTYSASSPPFNARTRRNQRTGHWLAVKLSLHCFDD